MADKTKIEWTEATWNPITGCSLASPGCTNCYAMQLAGTRLKNHPSRSGLTQNVNGNHVWTGEVRLNEEWLDQPLRWTKPRMIFVCAHGDLFHENVPDEWIDMVFAVMALCPQHTFQVLTKRSKRMMEYVRCGDGTCINIGIRQAIEKLGYDDIGPVAKALPNVWLGVSVEDQKRADQRIPDLLATPAAVRWISAEPLLGEIDLTSLHYDDGMCEVDALTGKHGVTRPLQGESSKLDWVVAGGESGNKSRPMHPDWVRSLRDQCAAFRTPFFFKQWGEWLPGEWVSPPEIAFQDGTRMDSNLLPDVEASDKWDDGWSDDEFAEHALFKRVGKKASGRLLDGIEHNGMPNA